MEQKMRVFVILACFLQTIVDGRECKIPEGEKVVDFSFSGCTTFSMEPDGNYSVLKEFRVFDSKATTKVFYDLIAKLTIAPALEVIQLGNNDLLEIFEFATFNPLKALRFLEISYCKNIKPVYTATEDNEYLRYLRFHSDKIETFDIPFFKRFRNLETISLANNHLSGLFDLGILSNFDNLNLNNLFIGANLITETINSKSTLVMPKITSISLFGNNLKSIDLNVFDSFTNLKVLGLGYIGLSGSFNMAKLVKFKKLDSLDLAGNQITRIINTGKEEMPEMTSISLDNNKLTFIDLNDFRTFKNLGYLSLQGNQLVLISGYSNAKTLFPRAYHFPINFNEFYCYQLEDMVAPYIGTFFWYDNQWPETTCQNGKIFFQNVTCCYF